MKTSFETRVSKIGSGNFVYINIFVKDIILFSFFIFSIFVWNLSNQNVHKGNLGFFFNDTLLNFGPWITIQNVSLRQKNNPFLILNIHIPFLGTCEVQQKN